MKKLQQHPQFKRKGVIVRRIFQNYVEKCIQFLLWQYFIGIGQANKKISIIGIYWYLPIWKKAYWLTDWQCWPVMDLTACHCQYHFHFCPIHQLWLKKNFKRKDLFHGGAKWPLQFQLHLLFFLPMIFYSPYLGSNGCLNAWFVKTDFNCMHLVSISLSFSSLILAFEVVYDWNAFLIRPKPKLAEKVIFLFAQAETNTKKIWDL